MDGTLEELEEEKRQTYVKAGLLLDKRVNVLCFLAVRVHVEQV